MDRLGSANRGTTIINFCPLSNPTTPILTPHRSLHVCWSATVEHSSRGLRESLLSASWGSWRTVAHPTRASSSPCHLLSDGEQETKSIMLSLFLSPIHPLLTDINGLDTPQRGMDETAVGVDQNVTLLHHWRRGTRQIRSNQIGGH